MQLVRWVGGSMDGTETPAPDVVVAHPQREVKGNDLDEPFEMYVKAEDPAPDGAVLFKYTGSSSVRHLDDDQNPLEPGAGQ